MADNFTQHDPTILAPITDAISMPNDTDLESPTRAIYVGTTGDVQVELKSGATATFSGMQGGNIYPIRVKQLISAGTTATGILALS